MTPSWKNQVAIITGASAGIGRAIAIALAGNGVRCVLAARRLEALQETAAAVKTSGGEALLVPTDVTQVEQLKSLVEKTLQGFGGLNILVNNAGIYQQAAVEELEILELNRLIATNLIAPMMLTKFAIPHLKKQTGSAVLNMASIAGTMGFSKGGAYSASKHGLIGFTETLFEEVREAGIKVCAICPGFVRTPMVAGGPFEGEKMIPAEDIAELVLDVLRLSVKSCPTRIIVRPQQSPY